MKRNPGAAADALFSLFFDPSVEMSDRRFESAYLGCLAIADSFDTQRALLEAMTKQAGK